MARAGARLPTSRTRRRRILRRTLIGSVIVHLLLVALFLLVPRVPPPDTSPAEPGVAMQFETPRPEGAASDTPRPDAGEGIEAPAQSPAQGAPPATPSPPTPELPLAAVPPVSDVPLAPVPPDAAPPDAQALQPPPVPPPPDVAPADATPPDAAALPDAPAPPAAEAPIAPAPETPEADMQVNAGPLAELFNLQPVPVPQPRPPPPPAPAPRPRATRPAPAFPTPREWAFTPAAPGGGSPARGASRGLNLSFSPRIRGGGGQSSPDFSAPDAGPDWLNELHAWWDRHGYFPREAAEAGEQGTLSLHLMVNHDGRVAAARLTMQSGSVWLDQGALALFRDARLPALPPQTEKPQIPVDLTIHYILR